MHMVVLAGGFGTRLQPVLKDLPKPLAPVGDKCFLELRLNTFKAYGLVEFTLCLHYMPEKIKEYFGDGSKFGYKINYSIEEKPMGTGGAIGILRGHLNETFCAINADTCMDMDIQACIAEHRKSHAIATLVVARVENLSRFGRIELDQDGLVKGFYEKDESLSGSGYINAGFYIFEPEIFDYIPENRNVSLEKEVFPVLFEKEQKVKGYPYAENFFDIGIPSDYYRFQQWLDGKEFPEVGG
ncbi:MAG: hypothetical protein A2Y21_02415 [Clostridiales bacterium GWC2_40_7]|nr:MAG: hypothetical protein A2Y21_02415 [Clostridiales bacterium GWC2_40_7]